MRCLIRPFLFLAATLLVGLMGSEVVNRWLIFRSPSSSRYKTYRLFVEKPRGDIPLLGSSRALGNYVPSLISPHVFDYGINGSGMYETLFLLREALKNPSPGAILVNLDPWGFHGEYQPSLQGDYRMALSNADVRKVVKYDLSDLIPGVRFHGQMRQNLTTWLDGKMSLTRQIDQGAALILQSRTEKEWEFINAKITDSVFSCHPSWQVAVDKIEATSEHPIVWIVSPIAPHWREHYHGREKLKEFLKEMAKRPNMYVVDLFDETADYSEAEFVDPTHLNIHGATRFTKQLLPYLKALPLKDFGCLTTPWSEKVGL